MASISKLRRRRPRLPPRRRPWLTSLDREEATGADLSQPGRASSTAVPRARQRQTRLWLSQSRRHGYHMCRAVKTVEALWSEWTVGLRSGPAIADLDSRWGSRWRAGRQNELQWYLLRFEVIREIGKVAKAHRCSEEAAMHIVWYSLRLEVIREIRKVAKAHRCSEEEAMHIVNLQQQQTDRSLDLFCKQLRASRKAQIVRPKR
ncbi:hypothetical protein HIM_10930 [Hirsutella minnesotensis 3608]|uniref:Transcription activator GCR1-like domain-containing protein n=1 Tax=Hirsutella minnesotensis 3608 TaxID=1043627 RepID=A0A0F7ZRI7_9HYPO|nr:hypothetical protein HIM_10930 [Hirsutella minnesotensis 3608]